MSEPDEALVPSWEYADAAALDLRQRMTPEPRPFTAGDGMGLNGSALENLDKGSDGGGLSSGLSVTENVYIVINGAIYTGDVSVANLTAV